VVQSGTLHNIQLHCGDPDTIFNICQCKIQSYWVNTSAGSTFCHKTSLLPEFCKSGHVLATVMGMRSHMSKLYSWEVTKIPYFPAHKTNCDVLLGILEKNNECILILVIDWKKTGLLHTN